jgi:TolA-binding protein
MVAALGQAYVDQAGGNLEGAAQTLSDVLIRAKDDPLAGEALLTLAMVHEELKRPDEAMRIYGQVSEQYTGTQWAQRALKRMSSLKGK